MPWLCELRNLHELNYSKNKPMTDCRVVRNIDFVWGVIIAIKIYHDMNQYRDIRYDTIYRAIATGNLNSKVQSTCSPHCAISQVTVKVTPRKCKCLPAYSDDQKSLHLSANYSNSFLVECNSQATNKPDKLLSSALWGEKNRIILLLQ